eukprot:SAG11_NODE_5338_length_1590_cov_1.492958_5_plen_120_part_00
MKKYKKKNKKKKNQKEEPRSRRKKNERTKNERTNGQTKARRSFFLYLFRVLLQLGGDAERHPRDVARRETRGEAQRRRERRTAAHEALDRRGQIAVALRLQHLQRHRGGGHHMALGWAC